MLRRPISAYGFNLLTFCLQSMLSGFSAAFLGPIATGPFDVIKTRLMAQSRAGELKYKVSKEYNVKSALILPTLACNKCAYRGTCIEIRVTYNWAWNAEKPSSLVLY